MNDEQAKPTAITTTDAGAPAPSDEHSLTVGPTGAVLLQHTYLNEKLAHFVRERAPDRVYHRRDLWQAIARKDYPSWCLEMRPAGGRSKVSRARPRNASEAARVGFLRGVANKPHAAPAFSPLSLPEGPWPQR